MLALWSPLINNLNNQGFDNTVITNNGASVSANGKIGSCYSFNGNDSYIGIDDSNLYNIIQGGDKPFTIMFWIYHADSTRGVIFGDYGLSGTTNFNIELATDHKIRFYWHNNPDKKFNVSVDESTWTHITIVYDGTKVVLYKNGEVQADTYVNVLEERIKTSGLFYIGRDNRTGATALNGMMNDFRIYDTALSPRDIKELSKALILHYPLSCSGGENLMINTAEPDASSEENWPRFVGQTYHTEINAGTRSVAEHGIRIDNTSARRVIIRFGSSSASYRSMNGFVPGETYTLSFDASWKLIGGTYPNDNTIYFRAMLYDDRVTEGTAALGEYYNIGTIKKNDRGTDMTGRCEFTFTVSDGITFIFFEIRANVGTTASYYGADDYIEIRNIKLEKGNKATLWCPAPSEDAFLAMGYDDNIEYDVSGYGHNGIHNNVAWSGDSPRYNGCYELNGTNSYIRIDSGNWKVMGAEELTVNEWAYADDWATQTNAHLWSCTEGGGFNTENGGTGKLRFPVHVYTNAEKTSHGYINTNTDNNVVGFVISDLSPGWHMFTAVYNTSGIKTYIDGVLQESVNRTSYGVYYSNATLFLGAEPTGTARCTAPYFNGKLSDFRMYYTTLSDSDILALYHTPISLSNTGTLLTQGELSEV